MENNLAKRRGSVEKSAARLYTPVLPYV